MSGSGKIRDRVALTARYIASLKPDPLAPYRIKDTLTRGLCLRVAQSGEKTWDIIATAFVARPRSYTSPWAAMTISARLSRRLAIAPTN